MNDKDMSEVGKQVVKRRRPDLSEKQTVQTEPGDNRKYILHSLRLADLGKVDLTSTEEVAQRITTYFEICAEDDMKPSVAGLALALDIDRTYLWEIRAGRKGKNPEVANTLKRAMKILDLQMVDYMQNGKINPVAGIFLMKNNMGYEDKKEITVAPGSPLGDETPPEELRRKYLDAVEIDSAEKAESE